MRIRVMAAVLLSVFLLTGCGKSRPAEQIISDMIVECWRCGDQNDENVQQIQEELRRADSDQYALWTDVLDYWDYAENEMQVNVKALPENLPQDDSLVLIVLGYALNPDGSMQDELIERLKTAKQCAEQYPDAYVLCTGGGTASRNPSATEGEVMGEWLLKNGLDEKRLMIENRSRTTAENALYSYEIIRQEQPQICSAAIISSSYHIPWGALMFETVFMQHTAAGDAPELHVAANCACPIENQGYSPDVIRQCEASGLLELNRQL